MKITIRMMIRKKRNKNKKEFQLLKKILDDFKENERNKSSNKNIYETDLIFSRKQVIK